MRKFDLSLRSSRSSYFATFRHQLTILSKTDALDEEKWLNMRSEERRVGKECKFRWTADVEKKKKRRIIPLEVVGADRSLTRDDDGCRRGVFFFKQKTAYEIGLGIPAEPLFRSSTYPCAAREALTLRPFAIN